MLQSGYQKILSKNSLRMLLFSYQKMLLKNILNPKVWYSKIMFQEYFWQMLF